ncbi:hypothetical protein [Oceanobacillus kapialis]|uniref:hypothetical protein n=1 Tax=Oceanobacillus kapialis TaxID=481353 RepID=UPI00384ADD32
MNKLIALITGLLMIAGIGVLIYYIVPTTPEAFYTPDEAKERINQKYPEAKVDVVQEVVKVKDTHAFVPYISEDNYMGASFWEWRNHKWELTVVKNSLLPEIWRLDGENPEDAYIVWNIHPASKWGSFGLYMYRTPYYYEMNNKEYYKPQIQFEEIYSLKEQTYGVQKIPEEWANFIKDYNSLEGNENTEFSIVGNGDTRIEWIPYDKNKGATIVGDYYKMNEDYGESDDRLAFNYLSMLSEIDLER